ncbi:MAG: DUF1993 domain-containing protein [Arenimonas sp.]|nr:DUF1993 domain-containing protein [Arenimonas sp.]
MQITLYATASTTSIRAMNALDGIIDKAVASAEARKIDPAVLLASRLAPDMFSLIRQIQIACDFGKGPMARLAGIENPKFEDVETTFPELKARIARVLEFVRSVPESSFAGAEDRDITIQAGPRTLEFKGLPYLVGYSIPNLYFHMSMSYAILRHNGVDIGKKDFIGPA